ncbi:MAG: helix-turn-helix domain-containing protein [Pigmentiphaga sp.]
MSSELKNPEVHARLAQVIGDEKPFAWADRVGISKGAFSRIWKEGTVPGPEHLCRIRDVEGISIDWLLTGQGEMRIKKPTTGEIVADADGVYRQSFTIKAPPWGFALVSSVEELIEEEVERRVRASARADVDPRLRDLKWWLEDFWKDADEERRTWLIVEMKRVYPEFVEWINKRGDSSDLSKIKVEKMDGFKLF